MNSVANRFNTVRKILKNLPKNWVNLTTHSLDIYNEKQAKTQFLEELTTLSLSGNFSAKKLEALPTAYDYIRLGHQLSSILEWLLAEINDIPAEQVITFTSRTMPVLAILRKNALSGVATYIYYNSDSLPLIDRPRLEAIYGYKFELHQINDSSDIPVHNDGTVVFVTQSPYKTRLKESSNVDVTVNIHPHFGSALLIHKTKIINIVKDVQHVRRRETIAITPPNALNILAEITGDERNETEIDQVEVCEPEHEKNIFDCIQQNTGSNLKPLIASSGLSIQYAIMMGLVENAIKQYSNQSIKIILPPNCYGGTNDQARRIADLIPKVEIVDLLVDGGQDLVLSLDEALKQVAENNGVPIVLAEIPTNPRVEVPDMDKLAQVLSTARKTKQENAAVEPVFMVDQTFCPNVRLLHQQSKLAKVKIISFSSGSKFPSGGHCIAGYCAANDAAADLLGSISKHLILSDNCAIPHQLNTLATNMPSMPERIKKAYTNTRTFVKYIQNVLPDSKINFVSDDLAAQGFTPSVFSLDLPEKGKTDNERENYKRELNEKLIGYMIEQHPKDCKYCVSYGQLKGSYWTIPATSTQGTTKETDKDYIVRIAISPDSDIAKLSESFGAFCNREKLAT